MHLKRRSDPDFTPPPSDPGLKYPLGSPLRDPCISRVKEGTLLVIDTHSSAPAHVIFERAVGFKVGPSVQYCFRQRADTQMYSIVQCKAQNPPRRGVADMEAGTAAFSDCLRAAKPARLRLFPFPSFRTRKILATRHND